VASGGKDKLVLVWNIDDYFNTSGRNEEEKKNGSN
jgi:hypothetical protein